MANESVDDVTSNDSLPGMVVGRIMGAKGEVVVVSQDGTKTKAGKGQELRLNDTVYTEGGSVAVIDLDELKEISIGHDTALELDKELLETIKDVDLESSISDGINFDSIERSLELGLTLDQVLPAPAAGGENIPTAAGSAGASAARIERTASEVTPESGFDTQGFVLNFSDISFSQDSLSQPFLLAQQNTTPEILFIGDVTVDQDQNWSINLADFALDSDEGQNLNFIVENLPDGITFDADTGIVSGAPTNAAALSENGEYLVSLTVQDDSGAENSSAFSVFTLTVNNLNDGPTVNGEVTLGAIEEDASLVIVPQTLLAAANDIDQDVLQVISLQLQNGGGQVVQNSDGNFEFIPAENWNGLAEFVYTISDGQGGEISNAASLLVSPVNDAPVAVNDGLLGTEVNTSLTVDVLANDFDVDGDTISLVGASANVGSIVINPDGTLTYSPASDFLGRDMITYTIADENGEESTSLALVNIVVGNTPPVLGVDQGVDVSENTLVVGNFSATDPQGDGISYALEGADSNLFQINPLGDLVFRSAPDFEIDPGPFEVTVIATDDGVGNLSSSQHLVVNVTDVDETEPNSPPTLGADATVNVAENTTAIGNFAGSDVDGDTLTYSIDNTTDFDIDADTGELSFAAAKDFETEPGPHLVTITATDPDGLSSTQTITVNITDANEAPSLGADQTIAVVENTTAIGTFAGNDVDGDTLTYSIDNITDFDIDADTGELSFVAGKDFETDPGPHLVTITAIDPDGLVATQTITVTITDANEAPTMGADASVDVVENTTAIGTFAGNDVDGDILTYSIDNTTDFDIDADTGELSFTAGKDFETEPGPHLVTITATDPDGLAATQTITVNISDANEAPTMGADTTVSVEENTTAIGIFAGSDVDGDTLTYSIDNTTDFDIDADTGELSFVAAKDFETDPGPHLVTITATDPGGLAATQTITVNITDANEAPSMGTDQTIAVVENTTAIGTFAGSDVDGDTLTYSIDNTTDFDIDADTGELSFTAGKDFETEPGPHFVTITATDPDGLAATQTITVNITDANEAPTMGADTTVSVEENITAIGTFAGNDVDGDTLTYSIDNTTDFDIDADTGELSFVAAKDFETEPGPHLVTITATDPDGLAATQTITVNITDANEAPSMGTDQTIAVVENTTAIGTFAGSDVDGDSLTYSINNTTDFDVDADTGELSFVAAKDFETDPGPHLVTITATDPDGLAATQTITVNITDANEAPTMGVDATVDVAENVTVIGTFAGNDVDGDTLTYGIDNTTDFDIDANTGELSFVAGKDFETEPGPHLVTITATDPDGLSATQTITVNITDANEAPTMGADASVDVVENTTAVGTFAGNDVDGDALTYSIDNTTDFDIDADTGELSFTAGKDFETDPGPHIVTVTATDPDGLVATQTITVNITDANEAPTMGADTTVSVEENITAIGTFAGNDVDGDTLTYSIDNTTDFDVDAGTGEISFVAGKDFETEPGPHIVTITATDPDGLAATQTITVNITDVNEAPTMGADASVDIVENTTAIGTFSGNDVDGDSLTYSINNTTDFDIDANTGELSFVTAKDFETEPGPHIVTITATDPDGLAATQTITVNITDVNEAPTMGADASVDIVENTTAIGIFSGNDVDGDTLTYSIDNTTDFDIDSDTGELSFVAAKDFETDPGPHLVTITATDPDGLSSTQTITVNITDANEVPTMGADASVDIVENTTAIGSFTGNDVDGDSLTYSIDNTTDFDIDADTGELSFVAAKDFETDPGPHLVTITATDPGGLAATQTITVNITDANEAPSMGTDQTIAVVENTTAIGTFAGSDVDGDTLTYSIDNTTDFDIDADTGELSFTAGKDFETEPGPHFVTITATDPDGLAATQTITVNITDANEAPTMGADTTVSVEENITAIGTFAGNDVDGDTLTYSIDNTTDFDIDADTGELSFVAAKDFETEPGPHLVTITATDPDGLAATQTITVNITDANEAPSMGTDQTIAVVENTTAIGTFAGSDVDGDSLTYSINNTTDFDVDADTGELSFVAAKDFETDPGPHLVTITATDPDGLAATQTITVNITDANEAPTMGVDATVDVAENVTVIGTFAGNDVDGDTLTYGIDNTTDFDIDANTGELSFVAGKDFETEPGPHLVTITATDPDGLSATQTITVNITDANEAPIMGADASVDVVENTTAVGAFAGNDVDGDTLTYSIDNATDFDIDANTGELSFVAAKDFETDPGPHLVTITATDPDGLAATQTITVNITDANEAPTMGADQTIAVVENTTAIGNFAGSDVDGDTLTYSIDNTTDFDIDASTGELSFVAAKDFETDPGPHLVTITAIDPDGLVATQTITVTITDANEAPTMGADASVDIVENTTAIGTFSGNDVDGDSLTYSINNTTDFDIDANTGELSFVTAKDFETEPGPHIVTITATDPDGLAATQTITVNITDVNEAPTMGADASVDIVENTTAIGIFSGNDVDGDTLTYSIDNTTDFDIDSDTGELSFVAAKDFETDPGPHLVTITATDPDGLSSTQTITVNITDANEVPTMGADASVDIVENTTAIGSFTGNDVDGDSLTYSIDNTTDFDIDADTGELSFVAAKDFETDPGPHIVTITATDPDGLAAIQTITVNITDANEAPTMGVDATVDVAENVTVIGTFAGNDVDGDTLTYSIDNATDFDIDANTGELSFVAAKDFETEPGPHLVTITATDPDGLAATQTITVNITDANEAPTMGVDATVDVAENVTVIGTFAGNDVDGDTLTYGIDNTTDFDIDANTGELSFVAGKDFETEPGPHLVTITATDPDGLSATQTISVNITDANEAPTMGADASVDVVENTTAVGTFAGNDVDGDALTYSIDNTTDFDIDADTGELSFTAGKDFETEPGPHLVTITATDPDGLAATQTITVDITDANEAPTMGADASVDVVENTTAVGTFTGNDVDGDTLTYSIDNTTDFDIDANTGELSFVAAKDFETEPGPHLVTITATDPDGLAATQTITVNITDANEAPTMGADQTIAVVENTTAIGNFAGSDVDGDTLTYSVDNTTDFDIDADTGELSFVAAKDFEADPGPHLVTITATDPDGLAATQTITVNITDANEAPTMGADASVDVVENTTAIGIFAGNDVDGDSLTYSIDNTTDFDIDADTGELSFVAAKDFETEPGPHLVTITAADPDGLSATQTITVNITDVNEGPILGADQTLDVAENTTSVANFAATDEDGDSLTYSIDNTTDFAIDASSGDLSFVVGKDFETEPGPHTVTITATDPDGLSDTQTVTVNITDINEAPILGADQTVDIVENTTAIANFAASDDDGDSLTYSIDNTTDFAIDASSGDLSFVAGKDFETEPGPHTVTITAMDPDGLSDTQTVTVNITDVNEGPILGADQTVDIVENTTAIANFAASDDDGDSLAYSIDNTTDFAIDANSGDLSFVAGKDFETEPGPHTVTITATDPDGLSDTQTVTVNITDVNEAPILGADQTLDIAENTTAIANFAATDEDGDSLTYSIDNTTDFAIDANSGDLSFVAGKDFETEPGPHTVTITATDPDGLSDTQTVTVNITDINEAPILGADQTVDIVENTTAIANFAASDDDGDSLTYSIDNTTDFAIDANSGDLSFVAGKDFETEPGPHTVTITAIDPDGLSDTQTITVNITDVNEGPILGADQTVDIVENTTAIANFAASDDDGDSLTYSIDNTTDFAIDANSGDLSFVAGKDFETEPGPHTVTITAMDPDGLSDTQTVTVNITDVNEGPILGADQTVDIVENTTAIANFAASDDDGDSLAYSIDNTTDFAIDANSGDLSFVAGKDFETEPGPHTVTITATDPDGLSDTQTVTVNITDVNEAPILGADQTLDIAENTTAIANFAATDEDGDSLTYSIDNTTDFAIDANSGDLSFVAGKDFETEPGPHTVTITATDPDGLSDTQTVTVNITDVNEGPILGADQTLDIAENTTAIANFAATDEDGDVVTYSVNNSDFQIDASGTLSLVAGKDFETEPGPHTVTITATDPDGLSATQTITVNVTDANEAPTMGADASVDIVENTTAIGIFSGNDVDGDTLTYSIDNTTDFDIDADTGELSFVAAKDFETDPGPHLVTITATDPDGLAATQTITVNITDANEAPTMGADTSVSVEENTTAIGIFAGSDVDGDTLTYSIDNTTDFDIDANTGELSFVAAKDFETEPGPHLVTITATDPGGLAATQTITVNITDANEAPTMGADQTIAVVENTTAIGTFAGNDVDSDSLTYSIDNSTDFDIDVDTGELSFTAAKDFETDPGPHLVTITATDPDGLAATQTITVNITDANEAPTMGADTTVDVAENTTAIGTFSGNDVDGDSLTYSIENTTDFDIDANTGELSFVAAKDFETDPGPHLVTITATDPDGLAATQTITVNITDANEAPTMGADASVDVVENTTAIGIFAGNDVDGDSLTYSIDNTTDFDIDADTGELSFVTAKDFETEPGPHLVTITAADPDGLAATQTITVNITDANEAPTMGVDATVDVVENTTAIGIFTGNDVDGDTLTYSIDNTTDFDIDADTGELSFVAAKDFETDPGPHLVTITATDPDGLSSTQTITVNVTDANEAPSMGADTAVSVEENTTAIGTFAGNDVDGDSLTYSIDNTTDFDIDANTGELSFVAGKDFETEPGPHTVTITATDPDGLSATQTITVNITDVNEGPILGADQTLDIAENTTAVANFAASDDDGDVVTYSVNNSGFQIDASGTLSLVAGKDFETEPGPHVVTITATDPDGLSATQTITVNITDVNEGPILGADQTLDIAENTTAIGSFSGSDDDGDSLAYSIDNTTDFAIDASSGDLSFVAGKDFETEPGPHTVTITATDPDGLSATQTITVNITDVNEGPILGADQTVDIAENTTAIANFAASDDDGDSLTYSIDNTTDFVIDASSGELNFVAGKDFETEPGPHTVTITATDPDGLSDTQTITVNITDVNEGPILGADQTLDVAENTTAVANFAASDDDGDVVTYSVNNSDFQIDSSGTLSLVAGKDFESEPGPHTVTITATDPDGLSDTQTVTVNITDINEGPILGADQTLDIAENTTAIGGFSGSDDDGDSLAYSIDNTTDFAIDANSGDLSFVAGKDFETEPGPHTVTITAIDPDGLSDTQTITVNITDVNEGPILGADQTLDIAENTTAIANFAATDEDGDVVTYSVNNSDFQIDASGTLSLVAGKDFETEPGPHTVTITATDPDGLSATQTITVNVTDANEAPTMGADASVDIVENTTAIGIFAGNDVDGDSLTYSIDNTTDFDIDTDTGELSFVAGKDFETEPGPHLVTITATDPDGLAATQTITVNITDVNEAPIVTGAVDLGSLNEDNLLLISPAMLLSTASDPDAGDTISAENLVISSGSGSLISGLGGVWFFNPTGDWDGSVTIDFEVTDGDFTVPATANLTVTAVADAPNIDLDSNVIDVLNTNEIPPPASTGLLLSFYDNLNNTDRDAALQEGIIDPANATSQTREVNGFGTPKIVNSGAVQTDGSTIEIETGDSWSVTGLIYLEAGNTYQFAGYHDDSIRVELGGQTMLSTNGDSWGNYGVGQTVVGSLFTAPENGYYSVEAFVNNVSGPGQFSLNLSVNGGAAKILDGSNFNIYGSLSELAAVGGQFGDFNASTDNVDGGYFPQIINAGVSGTYIEISNISTSLVDTDGSESLQSLVLGNIPVDAILTDGENSFTASIGSSQVDLLAQAWDLNNIKLYPPAGFSGDIQLDLSATSIENSNGDTATSDQSITVTVQDISDASTGLDGELLGDVSVLQGTSGNDILTEEDTLIQFYADSDDVHSDAGAFTFTFSDVITAVSSIVINITDNNGVWDPGLGGNSFGVEIESQSGGLSLSETDFIVSGGDKILSIDMSSQTISEGDTFSFGLDFDQVGQGNGNEAGRLADYASLEVTLEDGRTQTISIEDTGDNNPETAQANLQFLSDIILAEAGDDIITTGVAEQLVMGGAGNDNISLGGGNDAAYGEGGVDTLNGGAGSDVLSGGNEGDTILGGADDDIIFGDAGSDTLSGNSGSDIFVWRSQDDDGSTDTITDFELGIDADVLNFSDVLDGESADALTLDNYFNFSSDTIDTTITIDSDGSGGDVDLTVVIQGADLLALYGSDQAILQQLLDDGNLLTD